MTKADLQIFILAYNKDLKISKNSKIVN